MTSYMGGREVGITYAHIGSEQYVCVCVGVFGRVCLIWSAVCSVVMSHHVRHVRKLIVDNDPGVQEPMGMHGHGRAGGMTDCGKKTCGNGGQIGVTMSRGIYMRS